MKYGKPVTPTTIVWVSDTHISPGQYANLVSKYGDVALYRVSTESVETPVKGHYDGCTPGNVNGKTLKELAEFGILAFPDNSPLKEEVMAHGVTETKMNWGAIEDPVVETLFTPTFSGFLVATEANSCHKEWVMIQR